MGWRAALDEITNVEVVHETPYSYVAKLQVSEHAYYLKKTPPQLYIEASVIKVLRQRCGVTNVPEIIAKNDDLSCFLMRSCGDMTLRDIFDKNFDDKLFYKGLASYHELQVKASKHIGCVFRYRCARLAYAEPS